MAAERLRKGRTLVQRLQAAQGSDHGTVRALPQAIGVDGILPGS